MQTEAVIDAFEVHSARLVLEAADDTLISDGHGHQAYALVLDMLGGVSPATAGWLHDPHQHKPMTLSLLRGEFRRSQKGLVLSKGSRCSLRVTFLMADLFQYLRESAERGIGSSVNLGHAALNVLAFDASGENDFEVRHDSYLGMVSRAFHRRTIQLAFSSPTVFRSAGKRNVVLPQPELVFGSYLNKWNAFSYIKFDEGLREIFSQQILLARYQLETRLLSFGTYPEVGFIGRCTFMVDDSVSREALVQINALADFAFYAGTGAKTTMGMGQTRRIDHARSSPTST